MIDRGCKAPRCSYLPSDSEILFSRASISRPPYKQSIAVHERGGGKTEEGDMSKTLLNERLSRKSIGLVCLVILILGMFLSDASAQIPLEVVRRVFMIRTASNAGTSFTIDVDGRQYLITAKHLVAGLKPEDTIQIRKEDQWVPQKVKVLRCDDPIDIAVLIPTEQLSITLKLEPSGRIGAWYGQDVFFMGFPYGISTEGQAVTELYPMAFVKKGTMSGMHKEKEAITIFIDGHNNPGFSGGPVIYRDLARRQTEYRVEAVVSGYRQEITPVFELKEIKKEEITADDIASALIISKAGSLFRLHDTGKVVKANTGIVLGYSIEHAVDLIRKNPTGPKVVLKP